MADRTLVKCPYVESLYEVEVGWRLRLELGWELEAGGVWLGKMPHFKPSSLLKWNLRRTFRLHTLLLNKEGAPNTKESLF